MRVWRICESCTYPRLVVGYCHVCARRVDRDIDQLLSKYSIGGGWTQVHPEWRATSTEASFPAGARVMYVSLGTSNHSPHSVYGMSDEQLAGICVSEPVYVDGHYEPACTVMRNGDSFTITSTVTVTDD